MVHKQRELSLEREPHKMLTERQAASPDSHGWPTISHPYFLTGVSVARVKIDYRRNTDGCSLAGGELSIFHL